MNRAGVGHRIGPATQRLARVFAPHREFAAGNPDHSLGGFARGRVLLGTVDAKPGLLDVRNPDSASHAPAPMTAPAPRVTRASSRGFAGDPRSRAAESFREFDLCSVWLMASDCNSKASRKAWRVSQIDERQIEHESTRIFTYNDDRKYVRLSSLTRAQFPQSLYETGHAAHGRFERDSMHFPARVSAWKG